MTYLRHMILRQMSFFLFGEKVAKVKGKVSKESGRFL